MKKILAIFFIFHLALLTTDAQSLSEKYNAKRPVVVVCDWDKPPYEFLNNNGEPAGSNIDVMRAVMEEIGIPVKFVMKEWSTAMKTFERGNADIILANARRYTKEPYVLSENIINYNRVRVATHADSTGMVTFRQLEREGAVFKPGDYSARYFMDGDSKELNLEGIVLNDVGIPISEVHVVGRDRQLVEQIDDQYSRLKQRGEIATIQDRWFHPERIEEETDLHWLYTTLGILALMGIMWFFIWLARRHVIAGTRAHRELNDMMGQALRMGNFIIMEYDIKRDRVSNRHGNLLPADGLNLQEFTDRIHTDQQQEFIQKTNALLEGRERRFELDKRWNAGTPESPHWLNFQGHAICELDRDGRPAYIFNVIHDVTQEVEEDRAARNLVHKYQVLTNLPFVAMSFYDKDGYLYSMNDVMKELCAIDRDSNARHFWENVSMFDIPVLRGVISPTSKDTVSYCQHFDYPEFGLNKYIEVSIQPLFNAEGDLVNYLCTSFDLTRERNLYREGLQLAKEREQTQQEIALRDDRLQYLLSRSERYLIRSSIHDERITFFRTPDKPAFQHSFSRFQRILAKEDREAVMNILYDEKTRTPQTCTIHVEAPSEGQPGTVFTVTFHPIMNEQGEIIGHEGIASDITRITKTESELAKETVLAEESVRMKSAFMASPASWKHSATHRSAASMCVSSTTALTCCNDSSTTSSRHRVSVTAPSPSNRRRPTSP